MYFQLRTLLMAVAGIILAGCLETKQEVTINPNGSGKTVFEIKQPLDAMMNFDMGSMGGGEKKEESPDEKAKKEVAKILEGSEGVETWENVSYKIDDGNNLVFKGTAYFKSFNDVSIGGNVKSEKGTHIKTTDKGMTLVYSQKEKKSEIGEKVKPKKLSQKELAAKIRQMQAQLKQTTAMMGGMLKGFKDEAIFHLPGKIDKISNFTKVNDNTVSISMDGEKALKAMEAFANDKKAIAKAVEAGLNLQQNGPPDNYMNKKIFGNSGNVSVHVTGLKPLFNYNKAVNAAKKAYPAMIKKLGIKTGE